MSFVVVAPEILGAAATDLEGIGAAISAANAAMASPTTSVAVAAADEVSAAVASLFSGYSQAYQALGAQAGAFHDQFVRAMNGAAGSFAGAEAANASPLQEALNLINAPTQTLLGRPLIGDGANATAPGGNGGAGGLL
jgi:hypothetical protein